MRNLWLCVLFAGGWVWAQSEYTCRMTTAPPAINGALDDPCWREASTAPTPYELGVGGKTAANRTAVRMLMDEQALYLSVDAATAPGVMPNAKEREHDPNSWGDDCVELLLAPSFVSGDYYHFILTAAGTQYDSFAQTGVSPDEHLKWNPQWQSVTKMRPGGWTAEIAIPWVAFDRMSAPPPGHVWRVKLAAVAKSFPHAMWPKNEAQSFHENVWACVIWRDPNLVTNGDFERGIPAQGEPDGFMYAYHQTEGQGICSVTDEDKHSGRFAGKLEKIDDVAWFPVFYTRVLPLQPGSTYELRAMIKCDLPFVMRYNFGGERPSKLSTEKPATQGWQPATLQATVPADGVNSMTLGWQLIRTKGVILIDDVIVRRMNDVTAVVEGQKVPHPYHNLQELASRTSFKPHAMLRQDDVWYQPDRVIFKDTGTGAEIWMMARAAGSSTRHQYMEMSPWNADGSLLAFGTGQLGKGTLLMDTLSGAYRPCAFYASANQWDRRDPARIYFRNYRGRDKTDLWDLAFGNVLTGETTIGKRFEGDISLWPMSQDGEKLLIRETLVNDDGTLYSHLWIMDRDCQNGLMLDPGGQVHQTWFNKTPDYSIEFEWEGQVPTGQYTITTDGKVRKLFEQTTGHRAHSPNGEWIAVMAGCAVRNFRTGELTAISPEGSDHQTWETDNNWYATSSGRYLRRVVAFGSPTTQLIGAHNSSLKHSTYSTEAHPEMSHDGTKLGYASCMMGDIEFYHHIMGKPGAPREMKIAREGKQVKLTWTPPKYHKEIRGYLVYRSDRSGDWGAQITPEPIQALEFTDEPPAAPTYYRITSLDHSGLEGLPSQELCSDPKWPNAATVYAEAEAGKYDAPAVEAFDPRAAGLYGVLLGQLKPSGALSVTAQLPKAAAYHVWARVRGSDAKLGAAVDGAAVGETAVTEKTFTWIRLGQTRNLKAGAHEVALKTTAAGITVDRIMLTTDANAKPTGSGGMDEQPSAAPASLQAKAEGQYAVRLAWQPVSDPDTHHYNIYCGAAVTLSEAKGLAAKSLQPVQERLIASPMKTQWADWGLKAGTTYQYCVTAVDRAGNESPPSQIASAATPPLPHRLFVQLDQTWDTTQQPSVDLFFTAPADIDWVVWGKVQSLDGKSGAVKLALDGQDLGRQGIPFGYISIGHGGPVLKTPLWHCLRPIKSEPTSPLTFRAPAGQHTIKLAAEPALNALYEGFIITNDLGFVPEGTVNFRVEPK